MDDSQIIDLFFERSERAIAELSQKYEKNCMKLSQNILHNYEDAQECVNDAYLGVWKAIPPTRPNPLLTYLLRIVKNISVKLRKEKYGEKSIDSMALCFDDFEQFSRADDDTEAKYDIILISKYIDEFLDSINEENRMFFVCRYWYLDSFKDIADITGLTEAAVRKRMQRIRTELMFYLAKRGVVL